MKKRLVALFMGTSLALAACGGGDDTAKEPAENEAAPAGETADGGEAEKLFQQSCASCHGNNLEGGVGPNLTKVGNKYSEDEIENIIINGQGSMPKGLLKGEEATKVAEWLATQK
ncbi:cytochrome c551 [Bacillus sp. CGMCC 1.16541]|uniref:cytochrome c551 n=1 Tax=Bacillus sp. CGMCC 1.16541 TaxID=2185143 RepID=UPI000D727276|nr:cytochrome c [Bacillus sp. CGMCC 1.16541]